MPSNVVHYQNWRQCGVQRLCLWSRTERRRLVLLPSSVGMHSVKQDVKRLGFNQSKILSVINSGGILGFCLNFNNRPNLCEDEGVILSGRTTECRVAYIVCIVSGSQLPPFSIAPMAPHRLA